MTLSGVRIATSKDSPAFRRAAKIARSWSMNFVSGFARRRAASANSVRMARARSASELAAVLACLSMGETPTSKRYGEMVKNALIFLEKQRAVKKKDLAIYTWSLGEAFLRQNNSSFLKI